MVDTKALNPQKKEEKRAHPRQEELFLATVKGKETVSLKIYMSPPMP